MPFQALTDAPMLRTGARLNVMAVPQRAGVAPERLAAGASISLRFGHCCPTVREGRICSADAETAVLTLDGVEWALQHRATGVVCPGIVSEDWIVRDRAA